jgi:hypothetical protein
MNEPTNFEPVNCPHNKHEFPDVRTSDINKVLKILILFSEIYFDYYLIRERLGQ